MFRTLKKYFHFWFAISILRISITGVLVFKATLLIFLVNYNFPEIFKSMCTQPELESSNVSLLKGEHKMSFMFVKFKVNFEFSNLDRKFRTQGWKTYEIPHWGAIKGVVLHVFISRIQSLSKGKKVFWRSVSRIKKIYYFSFIVSVWISISGATVFTAEFLIFLVNYYNFLVISHRFVHSRSVCFQMCLG